ncbi:MAG: hypothetical protein IKV09_03295 [Alistipes sp.]|nr:hypothetical protein [Alistipes sp.]
MRRFFHFLMMALSMFVLACTPADNGGNGGNGGNGDEEKRANTVTRDSEVKPVRAAFYDEGDFMTTLYLTPGDIDYALELEDATWFLGINLSNDLLDGKSHSLESLGESSQFIFGMTDNFHTDKSFAISIGRMGDATGFFAIGKDENHSYDVKLEITVDGILYKADFVGEFTSVDVAPEVKTNYFICNGTEYEITEATLSKQDEAVWGVAFANSSRQALILKAPARFFENGGIYGFSQSADFVVIYDGRTYSKANGDNGTLELAYNASDNTLTLDFFNNNNLQFNFTGAVEE